jgi:hypothetical protein
MTWVSLLLLDLGKENWATSILQDPDGVLSGFFFLDGGFSFQ